MIGRSDSYLEITGEEMPEIPQHGGMLAFASSGIATCMSCNWRGLPNRVGGRVIDEVHPQDRMRVPRRVVGSVPSNECPACEQGDTVGEFLAGVTPMPKVGRNEPCPCGSGRKFKKCCGRA